MGFMFRGCKNLTTIPELDTSKVNDMQSMFAYCSKLTSIPQLDVSNVTNKALMYDMFYNCINLTDIGGFTNLKVSIELSHTEKLTRESVLNIFNNMVVVDNETIWLHNNVILQLTDEDIAIATQKGWLVVSD
jgi:surface protein